MKKNKLFLFVMFAMAFQLLIAQQPGDLDPTFGSNGIVQTAIGTESVLRDVIQNLTVQPDGKIIAMGNSLNGGIKRMAYVRYNVDGSLDQSFGDNGKVIIVPSSSYGNFAMDAEVLSDGKIISCGYIFTIEPLAGEAQCNPVLVRMNADGSLDTSFGDDGIVTGKFGNNNILPEEMVVQKDGKMVLAGYYNNNMVTMRYNVDGSIDNSYGESGFCVTKIEGGSSFVKAVALQEDNKVVVVGVWMGSDGVYKWSIARIKEDGFLDGSFGENGVKILSIGDGNDFAESVKIQKDGKIVIAGHSWDANTPNLRYSFVIARLNTDGSLDNSFAQSGTFRDRLNDEGENYLSNIFLSPEEEIYASFSIKFYPSQILDMGVLCLNQDGQLNKTFGKNGYATLDINGGTEISTALDMQPDGKVILGGEAYSSAGSGTPFTLARYIVQKPVNIASIDHAQTFTIYPNPVEDVLTINHEGNFIIQVFDTSGRMVMKAINTHSLNIASLAAGIYVVKLIADEDVQIERIIKL